VDAVYILKWIIGFIVVVGISFLLIWQTRGIYRYVREDISEAREELSIFLDKFRQNPKRTTLEVVSSVGLIVLVLLTLAFMMLNRSGLLEFVNSAFVKIIFFVLLIVSELGLWFRLRRLKERLSLKARISRIVAQAFVLVIAGGATLLSLNLLWSN